MRSVMCARSPILRSLCMCGMSLTVVSATVVALPISSRGSEVAVRVGVHFINNSRSPVCTGICMSKRCSMSVLSSCRHGCPICRISMCSEAILSVPSRSPRTVCLLSIEPHMSPITPNRFVLAVTVLPRVICFSGVRMCLCMAHTVFVAVSAFRRAHVILRLQSVVCLRQSLLCLACCCLGVDIRLLANGVTKLSRVRPLCGRLVLTRSVNTTGVRSCPGMSIRCSASRVVAGNSLLVPARSCRTGSIFQ